MNRKEKIFGFLGTSKSSFLIIGVSSFVTAVISYYIFIIDNYGCADAIFEGLYYYHNADWALQSGRWAVRYLNLLIGQNIVMPLNIVLVICICVSVAVCILKVKWNIKNQFFIVLIAGTMIVSPSIINQLEYAYMAISFSMSFLLSVVFYALGDLDKIVCNLIAAIALAISMGLYQSYLGSACALILMGAVIQCIDGKKISGIIKELMRYVVTGIAGCCLDILIYRVDLYARKLQEASRVREFGIAGIVKSFWRTVKECYSIFVGYYNDITFKRKYFFIVFGMVMLSVLLYEMVCMMKYNVIGAMFCVCILLMLPMGMNVIHILIPYNGVTELMQYQHVLIIPFGFALIDRIIEKIRVFCAIAAFWILMLSSGAVISLLCTYITTSNATFEGIRVSHEAVHTQTLLILSDVHSIDGYEPNVTSIVFVGFPKDSVVKNVMKPLFDAGITPYSNYSYWEDMNGIIKGRYWYLLNYCGIDSGYVSQDDYEQIVNSREFDWMPIWPAKGSVAIINDKAVVKLSNNPLENN